jgi:cysteinyl-tRNA synthetase
MTHLGPQIDIHGGGSDLIYPHHTNEIAQAEGVTGDGPFCAFWLHNGMLKSDGRKMAKSKPETLVFARDLMARFEPTQLRLYLLGCHYRADANYLAGDVAKLDGRYRRLRAAALREDAAQAADAAVLAAFRASLDDDFDTPRALEVLDETAARIASGAAGPGEAAAVRAGLATLGFDFAGARGPATRDFNP